MEIYCIRMEFPTRLSTAIVFSRDILQRVLDKYEEECTIWVDYIKVNSIDSVIYNSGEFGEIKLFQEGNRYIQWEPYIGEEVEQFMEYDGELLNTPILNPRNPSLIEDLKSSGFREGTVVIKSRHIKYEDGNVVDMSITTDSVLDIKEELIKLKEDNIRRAKEMYAKTKRVPKNAIPVTYNGTHYRSKAECMACEDISSFQLERYLKNIDTKK